MKFARNLALFLAAWCLLAPSANADTINYALGKPATASNVYRDYVAANGNDGSTATYWNGGGPIAWWQVDLLAVVKIDKINVSSGNSTSERHHIFQLSSSINGSDWSPIGAATSDGSPSWTIPFDTHGAAMRYVTYQTIDGTGDWASVVEFEALGSSDQGPSTVPEPASLVLLGTGLVGAARAWRKRKA